MVLFLGSGSSNGSKVLLTGLDNILRLNWDNSAIGVGNKTTEGIGKWVSSIAEVESAGVGESVGSKVASLNSEDLWGLGWDDGTVGVGDKLSAGNSDASEENLK